jgi:hypothetical protein
MTEKLDFLFGQGSSNEKCKGMDLSRMSNIVCKEIGDLYIGAILVIYI